ncbi:glycosyltransferase family 39 protein [Vogesella sp. LIG4]|uniref:ArnT family glycosyltransferase n=1 Tax=Vogesella sp. LIG4 TaxID=1192162 RepID=UPI00081FBBD4|nr:glycosyltransferase family 39 protein [Vogesella sp. LIG4]SCK18981.1 4-amino-4-deoxy-L-arabinose transferase and related glycosyltransferases of PMT family [Vogesella sp. LIG4]
MISQPRDWLSRLQALSLPAMLLLVFAWLALTAGIRPLMLPDEGRYVGVAWEMLSSGRLEVPLLDGLPFFHKPPLFYWLTALGLKLFGLNVWGARLASMIGGTVGAISLWWFLRQHVGPRRALLALLVLVTQPFFFAGSQFANLDMLVAGMISATIVFAAHAVLMAEKAQPYRRALALAYLFAALGMLAKGLIGFVLPGGVLVLWVLLTRRYRAILTLLWLPGIALFLAAGLPWFVAMQQQYHGFFDYFVIYHHFKRFSQTGFNNSQPFWFYVPVLLLLALPWSGWLWQAIRRSAGQHGAARDVQSLLLCWLGLILLFFSLPASKLIGYILPTVPPLAALLSTAFAGEDKALVRRVSQLTVVGALICVAAVVAVSRHDGGSARPLALQMRSQMAAGDRLVMLDQYQYDLPFYLKLQQPAWVISRWHDADIPLKDNWRKELYDAGLFDPAAGKETLLTNTDFASRLCDQRQGGDWWLWGDDQDGGRYPWLGKLPPALAHGKQRVWRLTPAIRQAYCGTPSNG